VVGYKLDGPKPRTREQGNFNEFEVLRIKSMEKRNVRDIDGHTPGVYLYKKSISDYEAMEKSENQRTDIPDLQYDAIIKRYTARDDIIFQVNCGESPTLLKTALKLQRLAFGSEHIDSLLNNAKEALEKSERDWCSAGMLCVIPYINGLLTLPLTGETITLRSGRKIVATEDLSVAPTRKSSEDSEEGGNKQNKSKFLFCLKLTFPNLFHGHVRVAPAMTMTFLKN
jgi:hypothetical protein